MGRLTPEEVAVYFWLQSRFSEYMQVELDGKIDQLPWNIYLLGNLIRRVNLRVLELHPEHIAASYEELANLDIKIIMVFCNAQKVIDIQVAVPQHLLAEKV